MMDRRYFLTTAGMGVAGAMAGNLLGAQPEVRDHLSRRLRQWRGTHGRVGSLVSSLGASAFHVYCGYAGWTGPQLRHEVDLREWFIFPGDAATVFDPDPGSLWSRLIEKTETLVAMNLRWQVRR
jgi:hypothetical protein